MSYFKQHKVLIMQYLTCILGAFIYSFGFNYFILPYNLYSAGFFGTAQLLQHVLSTSLHLDFGVNSISIIYWILNFPLFFLLYKCMRKSFFFKTILVVTAQSIFLVLIPVPTQLLVADRLTAVITGAIISGIGLGLILRAASTSGGLDIIGVYITQKSKTFSVGKIGFMYNICLYAISGLLFGAETMIYSIICVMITSFIVDRFHYQNISISSLVITRKPGMSEHIMKELNRGSTYWRGTGAYTKEEADIILTVISKYEKRLLTRIVQSYDPHAFVLYTDQTDVRGNFIKRLDN